MQAVTYSHYGPPEVLQVSEIDAPEPGAGDVLIRVRAAEATKADCELRRFRFAVSWFWLPLRLAVGIFRPRRNVLGGYFSGEIAAVGADVTQFVPGDAVYGGAGLSMGAYGEYLVLPEAAAIAAKPANMTFEEAAAVPLGGLNALHFMRLADIAPGDAVLINGAGGSIGAHATQIAVAMGAEVTGVDTAAKEHFVRGLGATHFIDYTTDDFTRLDRKWDVVFDMVPHGSYGARIATLNPGGRYLTGNPRLSVMLRSVLTTRFTTKRSFFRFASESREALDELRDMIEAGTIRPILDRVMSIEDAAEAHRLVESEARIGAIVLAHSRS